MDAPIQGLSTTKK